MGQHFRRALTRVIFQIGTQILAVSTYAFHSTNLFCCFSSNQASILYYYTPYTTHSSLIHPDKGLMLETSAFEFLQGGQFTLSTQLIKPNYLSCRQISLSSLAEFIIHENILVKRHFYIVFHCYIYLSLVVVY